MVPQRISISLIRKTATLEIVDIQNTVFKNGSLFSVNSDTDITVKLSSPSRYLKIVTSIVSDDRDANTKIYYSENKNFSEENILSPKLKIDLQMY